VPFPKRLGTAAEFARLVRSLLEISYINAEVVRIDGGLRMQPK
jgi:NAD(P)-dependent dehydrogenase (short-subunit alcohol dehydrogenase family)